MGVCCSVCIICVSAACACVVEGVDLRGLVVRSGFIGRRRSPKVVVVVVVSWVWHGICGVVGRIVSFVCARLVLVRGAPGGWGVARCGCGPHWAGAQGGQPR